MGNTPGKSSRRLSTASGNNVKRIIPSGGGAGLPAPPGKPVLIPASTEDPQPDIVGIRWERSLNNGGSAIIGYLVEHRRMGSPHWVRSSPNLCSFPELTLSGLEPGWRYQFRVRAQNGIGLSVPSELSDPLTVTLQRSAATAPRFDLEMRDVVALENEQAEFIVKFSGTPVPKISWFKDGFEIFSSRRTKIVTENGKSILLIHQTALNDEGEIKCTATNRAGHVSTRGKLILEAYPRIRLPRQYEDGLLFEQDETIRLKLSVAGKPPPTVTWYHDGEVVKSDERHIIEALDSGECSMKIPAAKRKDRGEYTVKAVNKLGEDIASFLVTVTDRPAAPGKATIAMTLGRSVTLAWKEPEDDGGCKIGTYIVEYYRIGWDVWLKAATCRQPTTTLGELIEGSEYKFRVKAENPYGVSDPSDESDVIFIPDPKRGINSPPPRPDKSQSQREIHRGRSERRDQSEHTKRTRSLTREEAIRNTSRDQFPTPPSRSVSAHKLSSIAPPKPPRADSRVTFADTVFLHVEKPLEDAAPIPPVRPRSKRDRYLSHHDNYDDEIETPRRENLIEKASSITSIPKKSYIDSKEDVTRFFRDRSPSPAPKIHIQRPSVDNESKTIKSALPTSPRSSKPSLPAALSSEKFSIPPRESIILKSALSTADKINTRPVLLTVDKKPIVKTSLSTEALSRNVTLQRKDQINVRSTLSPETLISTKPVLPREESMGDEDFHGSSEFMLVLYPDQKNGKKNPLIRSASDGEAEADEDDEDLVPPPMSLSLPELFSADHQVVQVLREAVSSTELLYERAMERFFKAVAVEEAEAASKHEGVGDKQKEGLDFLSGKLRSTKLRRRLSAGSSAAAGAKGKWSRRRSSESQASPQPPKGIMATLTLPAPQLIVSDPNLHQEEGTSEKELTERIFSGSKGSGLHRWDVKSMPLVPETPPDDSLEKEGAGGKEGEEEEEEEEIEEPIRSFKDAFGDLHYRDVKTPDRELEMEPTAGEEDYEESTDEGSESEETDSEDLKTLKARLLAQPVIDEEDTYHPRGRPVAYSSSEPDTKPLSEPLQPGRPLHSPITTGIQPKSILKKRTEDEPVPLNHFGRPIPPEKPILERQKGFTDSREGETIEAELPKPSRAEEHEEPEVLEEPVEELKIEPAQPQAEHLEEPPVIFRQKSPIEVPEPPKPNVPEMGVSANDDANILNAAEAAKSRRRQSQSQKPELEKKPSIEEQEDLEARMAVVDHYTEIVREYASAHQPFPPRWGSWSRSSSTESQSRYNPSARESLSPATSSTKQSEPISAGRRSAEPIQPIRKIVEPISAPKKIIEPISPPKKIIEPILPPKKIIEPISSPKKIVEPISTPISVPKKIIEPISTPVSLPRKIIEPISMPIKLVEPKKITVPKKIIEPIDPSEILRKEDIIQTRRNNAGSRSTTPFAAESRLSRRPIGADPTIPRSRNSSVEPTKRSSSTTRTREPSEDRIGSRSSSRTRRRDVSTDRDVPGSRSSSRQRREIGAIQGRSSRASSKSYDMSPSDSETSQRLHSRRRGENRLDRSRRSSSKTFDKLDGRKGVDESSDGINERLIAAAKSNVESTMSYVVDLVILIAAAYVYLFKKEILAIPLIGLLLYRRIQEDVYGWIPKWLKSKPKEG